MGRATTAQRLREVMDKRNLRQVDVLEMAKPFCERYGIKLNKNDISQYLSGKVQPKQDKLSLLGMTLNVSEGWLNLHEFLCESTHRLFSLLDDTEKDLIIRQIRGILSSR